jgi:acetyl-CoA carboxylase carboxyltransferase component
MCGRAYQPRFLWTWPNSRISVMGGEQAADVLATVKDEQRSREGQAKMTDLERGAFRKPTLDKYEAEGNPYFATGRLWDDGILDPVDTRRVLALGLSTAANGPSRETRFGVFRM